MRVEVGITVVFVVVVVECHLFVMVGLIVC